MPGRPADAVAGGTAAPWKRGCGSTVITAGRQWLTQALQTP